MFMKLTWKLNKEKQGINVQVPSDQKMKETLKIFVESGLLDEEEFEHVRGVCSVRRKEHLNKNLTYEQGNIYPGDILYIE